jgi:hypothetical protein
LFARAVASKATSLIWVNEGNLKPQFLHLTINLVNNDYELAIYIKIMEDPFQSG